MLRCTLKSNKAPILSSILVPTRKGIHSSAPPRPPASKPAIHQPVEKKSGDYNQFGTDSDEYYHLDTAPASPTPPYESPRHGGKQLGYGGRDYLSKDNLEAFGEMSGVDEGPDGTEGGGRHPERDERKR